MLKKTIAAFLFLTIFTLVCAHDVQTDRSRFADEALFTAMLDEGRHREECTLLAEGEYIISAYDAIIRDISEPEGNDWRFISAIAYHESRFRHDVVSDRGAQGLMQIMPVVARQFEVPDDSITDLRTNIWLANKLLGKIRRTFRFPLDYADEDRMRIVLACYNGGIGHVSDARRLAGSNGENPDAWEVVSHYLALMDDPAYYEHEAVRCGRFTGSRQTVAFVEGVMSRYRRYCSLTQR